jgi:hypothetical protein
MASPRFNNRLSCRAIQLAKRNSTRWVRVPELQLSDSGRKLFAIVSRPSTTGADHRKVRRILIFDNHPDSISLMQAKGLLGAASEHRVSLHERRTSTICGAILIAMVIAAMLWPLLW